MFVHAFACVRACVTLFRFCNGISTDSYASHLYSGGKGKGLLVACHAGEVGEWRCSSLNLGARCL